MAELLHLMVLSELTPSPQALDGKANTVLHACDGFPQRPDFIFGRGVDLGIQFSDADPVCDGRQGFDSSRQPVTIDRNDQTDQQDRKCQKNHRKVADCCGIASGLIFEKLHGTSELVEIGRRGDDKRSARYRRANHEFFPHATVAVTPGIVSSALFTVGDLRVDLPKSVKIFTQG